MSACPDDLLAISILVTGGGVNEVEVSVESTLAGRDDLLQWQLAVGKSAAPEHGDHKTGASLLTARMQERRLS